jgi:hypothetical protein
MTEATTRHKELTRQMIALARMIERDIEESTIRRVRRREDPTWGEVADLSRVVDALSQVALLVTRNAEVRAEYGEGSEDRAAEMVRDLAAWKFGGGSRWPTR